MEKIGEYYFSAPTSPSHLSQFYNKGSDDLFAAGNDTGGGLNSTVPFDWEEMPGAPKSSVRTTNNDDDFAFDVIRNYETAPLSAEELFDGGLIKPLKPPPRLHLPLAAQNSENVTTLSPRKSSVSQTRKIIQGAFFSPRHKNTKETDPFALAEKTAAAQRGPSSRRAARSLSPIRDRRFSWGVKEDKGEKGNSSPSHTVCSTLSLSAAPVKGYKKWRLKDIFLFRSASEGRAADKDPLKKYTAALRGTSFGATEGSGSGTGSRRRGPVSAHELHYTVNRAVSEDLKKKTFLPYKQGILGRLAFNPAVSSLANGFGFSRK